MSQDVCNINVQMNMAAYWGQRALKKTPECWATIAMCCCYVYSMLL